MISALIVINAINADKATRWRIVLVNPFVPWIIVSDAVVHQNAVCVPLIM